ncbi:hypothetical protein Nepgr_003369 [Nepenthes gracilis]|uniref:TPX2 C-terminal domain-containing protein n=1 Tax=Nepenthes gracilis TaxID=150966 RepID=A0AAD3XDQ4_NEPGR|nr:hypothetical protein Nepgr_003369 [Nepenthes gracilis]
MGESTCLMRSFTHPSEISLKFKDGDPLRALGESVSFGRYMSESLAWEKWSTFSHNRYLEEAEKHSKPGSVAKMKAYFEAHYKGIAAKKQATMLEQANEDANNVTDLEVSDAIQDSSSLELETPETCRSSDDKHQGNHIPYMEPVSSVPLHSCSSMMSIKEPENDKAQGADLGMNESSPESSAQVEMKQSKDAKKHDISTATPEQMVPLQVTTKKQLDSKIKKDSADASLKRSAINGKSNVLSSLLKLAAPVCPKKEEHAATNTNFPANASFGKRILASKSLHTSINVDSHVNVLKRNFPAIQEMGIRGVLTPTVKIKKENSTPTQTPSRAFVNGIQSDPFVTPQSETRRNLKCSNSCTLKARSIITFSPFSFRCEERAAKRREFFQKQLEKEAEKMQLLDKAKFSQRRKKKEVVDMWLVGKSKKQENEPGKLPQIMKFKAKEIADTRIPSSSMNMKKIPPTVPRSPKLGRKPASQETQSRPPRGPLHIMDGLRQAANKNKIIPTGPKKKRHENASPNIL